MNNPVTVPERMIDLPVASLNPDQAGPHWKLTVWDQEEHTRWLEAVTRHSQLTKNGKAQLPLYTFQLYDPDDKHSQILGMLTAITSLLNQASIWQGDQLGPNNIVRRRCQGLSLGYILETDHEILTQYLDYTPVETELTHFIATGILRRPALRQLLDTANERHNRALKQLKHLAPRLDLTDLPVFFQSLSYDYLQEALALAVVFKARLDAMYLAGCEERLAQLREFIRQSQTGSESPVHNDGKHNEILSLGESAVMVTDLTKTGLIQVAKTEQTLPNGTVQTVYFDPKTSLWYKRDPNGNLIEIPRTEMQNGSITKQPSESSLNQEFSTPMNWTSTASYSVRESEKLSRVGKSTLNWWTNGKPSEEDPFEEDPF